jgi:GTP pyrophosphokinase
MRTLQYMPLNKQIKITGETIYLFAPLAYRLGLYPIKSELEDLCMKYRFPEEYEHISGLLAESANKRQEYIDRFCKPIIEVLDRNNIKYEISGRVKSVYSIWTKMQRKQIPFEEVYDLFAIRIVFQTLPFPSEKTQCWQIYSSITDIYTPKPDRLRDWISMPKANGYEALHSTVMGPDGVWVEVQIRTQRMDEIAERGFAAHWKYKHATISHDEDEFDKWLKMIRTAFDSPTQNAVDFLDNFKLSLYTSEIPVFTPKGESRRLPYGATALDFAYDIHTKIGNSAIGAKINHKIMPITTPLNSGDQVEIITAESARPKAEWLEHAFTTKAKQAIKNFLKREQEHNLQRGMQILDERLAKLGITPNNRVIRKLIESYDCSNKDELYTKVGAGIVSLDNLEKVIRTNSNFKILKFWTLFIKDNEDKDDDNPSDDKHNHKDNQDSHNLVVAECCHPLPGDSVVGFKDPITHQIIVHKATCDELNRLASQHGECIVKEEIKWSQLKTQSSLAKIQIKGIDRMGVLVDLANVVTNDFSINMREINIQTHDGILEGTLSLYVRDAESLNAVLDRMRRIKGMDTVKRQIN